MKSSHMFHQFIRVGLAAALTAAAAVAFSAEPTTSSAMPSKEMREKMAVVHEQMAACLRSDKSMAECRTESMQRCQQAMGQQGCQNMGMGMGMGHDGMMKGMKTPPAKSAPDK